MTKRKDTEVALKKWCDMMEADGQKTVIYLGKSRVYDYEQADDTIIATLDIREVIKKKPAQPGINKRLKAAVRTPKKKAKRRK